MKIRNRIGAAIVTAFVALTCATPALAGEPTPFPRAEGGIMHNGTFIPMSQIPELFAETVDEVAPDEQVQPMLLDPVDLTACNVLNATNHEIRRIDGVESASFFGGGSVSLTCGNSGFGYRHIRDSHENQWRDVLTRAGTPSASWDDYMFYVTMLTLIDPDRVTDHGGDKLCYTSYIVMIDENMVPVMEYKPTVVIAANNKWIITSFPGGGCRGV